MKKTFGKTTIKTAGTTFGKRQNYLWYIRQHMNGAYVTLKREKNNENDPNAVAVIVATPETGKHCKVGYLPKNKAFWVAKAIDEGRIVKASNPQVVGNKGQSLGLHFSLAYELPAQTVVAVETVAAEEA